MYDEWIIIKLKLRLLKNYPETEIARRFNLKNEREEFVGFRVPIVSMRLLSGYVYTPAQVFGFKKYSDSQKNCIRIRWPFAQEIICGLIACSS